MNRIKKVSIKGLIISIFVLLMPLFAYAETTVTIDGATSVSPGDEVEFTIKLSELQVGVANTFNAEVNFDTNVLTFKEIKPTGKWITTSTAGSSPKAISIACEDSDCGKEVGKLVFKVKDKPKATTAKITFKNVNIDLAGEIEQKEEITKSITIKSSDATLSSIKVNDVQIDGFAADTYTYDVSVTGDVATAKITTTTTSSKATYKTGFGPRTVNLEYGNNTIKITVISESGTELTYDINITREDTRSSDATLSGITIDGTALDTFKSNKYKYTVKKYKAETVKIEAITNDPNAKAEVQGPEKLLAGENEFKIVVTSEKGEKATYTVIINNLDKNISKMLKSLTIKGYNINFDKNNYQYKINYNRTKFEDLKIYFTTVSPDDEVSVVMKPDINNNKDLIKDLHPGDEIEIVITGIDGESSKYTIVIEKDKRVSFFLIFELFLIFVILIVIAVIWIKRKKEENKEVTPVKVDKEEKKETEEKKLVAEPRRERRRSGELPKTEEDPELEMTKELTTKELKL